jgi:methyltransferase-like protein
MLPLEIPKNSLEILKSISRDIISNEQYMDFIRNRAFRSSLLCHKNQVINHEIRSFDFSEFLVSLTRNPGERPTDFSPYTEYMIAGDKGQEMRISNPLVKATIAVLCELWPRCIDERTLFTRTDKLLNESGGNTISDQDFSSFMRELYLGLASGMLEFHTWQPEVVNRVSEHPKISELATYQARAGEPVVNQRHRAADIDTFDRQLLGIINGAKDMDTIYDRMIDLAVNGTIKLEKDGVPETDLEVIRGMVREMTGRSLSKLASSALLVQ